MSDLETFIIETTLDHAYIFESYQNSGRFSVAFPFSDLPGGIKQRFKKPDPEPLLFLRFKENSIPEVVFEGKDPYDSEKLLESLHKSCSLRILNKVCKGLKVKIAMYAYEPTRNLVLNFPTFAIKPFSVCMDYNEILKRHDDFFVELALKVKDGKSDFMDD